MFAHMDDQGRAKMGSRYNGNNSVALNYSAIAASEPGYYAFIRVPEKNASIRIVQDNSASSKATNARDENPRGRKNPQPARKPPTDARGFAAAAGSSKGSQRNAAQPSTPNNNTECLKCRKLGHFAQNCKGKPFCIRCRKEGHRTGRDGKCQFLPQDGHAAAVQGRKRADSPRRARIRLMQKMIDEYGADLLKDPDADFL